MVRRLLIISLLMATTCLSPVAVSASSIYFSGVMELTREQEVNISYSDGFIVVTGAAGYTMEVVSLTGKKVLETKIESPAQKVELNIPKGCYIVKIGNVVRKISVR